MWHLIVGEGWCVMGWDSNVEGRVGVSSYLLASGRHFYKLWKIVFNHAFKTVAMAKSPS